ncbi:hypothetical protein EU527_06930 [Candidatus Thorarchaeota archaeon]|nr:MAG: hypothetical protein EU527_06930 [Candidatus Thorarchaeota archaeon]
MQVSEKYVRLCGMVSNLTREMTGTSFVDAFFGPEFLNPEQQPKDKSPEEIIHEIETLIDSVKQIYGNTIRGDHLLGECHSMKLVVEWLIGKQMSYDDLVHGLFHIPIKKFSESTIDALISSLDDGLKEHPGSELRDRVDHFNKQGEITGLELKYLVEKELQTKSVEVGSLFKKKIFTLIGTSVTDNGVEYQTVNGAPWSGYNWYQQGFKSINQFNLDVTFNRSTLQGVIYHEYEHHVSNLWREKYYHENGDLELSVVPLHTGRCVISEGTADTAKEFLGVKDENPQIEIADTLYSLRRMTSINAAIMLNHEGKSVDDAIEYMYERGFRTQKSAESSIAFIAPKLPDGRTNFWAPYIFTYFFGRTDFVLPTFKRAVESDELIQFYQTLYLNPYSSSSVTWKKAFSWL